MRHRDVRIPIHYLQPTSGVVPAWRSADIAKSFTTGKTTVLDVNAFETAKHVKVMVQKRRAHPSPKARVCWQQLDLYSLSE